MENTPKPSTLANALHADVRRLLKKYKCDFGLHQVRAQFMGAIASPVTTVNPMQELSSLWHGALPKMKSSESAEELVRVMTMGLWNKLASQIGPERRFELTKYSGINSDAELRYFAQVKCDELESFLTGYFQGEGSLTLTPEIDESIGILEDLAGMFAGIVQIPAKSNESEREIRLLMKELQKLAEIAETELNLVIQNTAEMRRYGGDPSRTLQ